MKVLWLLFLAIHKHHYIHFFKLLIARLADQNDKEVILSLEMKAGNIRGTTIINKNCSKWAVAFQQEVYLKWTIKKNEHFY